MKKNRFLKLPKLVQMLLVLLFMLVICLIAETGSCMYFRSKPSLSEKSFSTGFTDNTGYGESIYLYYPFVSYRYRSNTKSVRPLLDTDSYGFIHNGNPDRNLKEKEEGVYRIFMLGGSSVAGTYVSSPQTTLSGQLEKKINLHILNNKISTIKRIEVINTGVSGYNSAQELAFMVFYLMEFSPDMFIVFDGHNDFFFAFDFPSPRAWLPNRNPYHVKQFTWLNKHLNLRESIRFVVNNLTAKSYFLRLLYIKLQEKKKKKTINPAIHRPIPAKDYPIPDRVKCDIKMAIKNYRSNLKAMIGFCMTHNIGLSIFLQPTLTMDKSTFSKKEKELLLRTAKDYKGYTSVRDAGEKENFLDAKRRFFKESIEMFAGLSREHNHGNIIIRDLYDLFNGNSQTLYGDHCHYNDKGRDIITDTMLQTIKPIIFKRSR